MNDEERAAMRRSVRAVAYLLLTDAAVVAVALGVLAWAVLRWM